MVLSSYKRTCSFSRISRIAIASGLLLLISACSSVTSTRSVIVDSGQTWAILPIENISTTPMAGHTVATLIETQLRKRGVNVLEIYPEERPETLAALLDGRARTIKAASWARSSGFRYAVTGTVSEWHYKSGTDKEPAVGVNLKLVDVPTGDVLWQANSARTGWGYANLSRVGSRLVADMVDQLKIRRQSINNTVAYSGQPSIQAANSPSVDSLSYTTPVIPEPDSSYVAPSTGPVEISIPGLGAALPDDGITGSDISETGESIEQPQSIGSTPPDIRLPSGRLLIPGAEYRNTGAPGVAVGSEVETLLSDQPSNPGIAPGN